MERAYRRGFEDAQSERPAAISQMGGGEGALDWVTIPPRPRNAFWTICLFSLGRVEQEERSGHLVPATTERLTDGWQLLASNGRFEKTFGEKTIVPLVRLGLLELAVDPPERLLISDLGTATWRLFIRRGGQFPEDLSRA